MKKSLLLFYLTFIVFVTGGFHAYSQQEILTYEGYAEDANGRLINTEISLRLSIIKDNENGSVDYVERHQVTTDDAGYFYVRIGQGLRTGGAYLVFEEIDWSGQHFLKVEMDPTGNDNFTYSETEEFTYVPYALRAEVAEDISGIDKSLLLQAISGGCSCTLQEAYDNGSGINLTTNGAFTDAVTLTNSTGFSGSNLISRVQGTATNTSAGYFYTWQNNVANTAATIHARNDVNGSAIFAQTPANLLIS